MKQKEKVEVGKENRVKIALQVVCFVVIFLVLLTLVSYMVRTNGDVKDRFAGFYAEKKDSLDIVMIGSSPVFLIMQRLSSGGRAVLQCIRCLLMCSALWR